MAFTLEHTATHRTTTYTLTVTAHDDGHVSLDLLGLTDADGIVAKGDLSLPPGGAAQASKLLTRALTAISALEGRRRVGSAPNAHAPWDHDQDAALRGAWQSYPETTPATSAIRELATARQRSPGGIRARLSRLGCDPDVPGRMLSPESASLLGRTTT
ncbi:hypothetical protein ACTG9Q_00440 [Actinokineospora sp. 24-640]